MRRHETRLFRVVGKSSLLPFVHFQTHSFPANGTETLQKIKTPRHNQSEGGCLRCNRAWSLLNADCRYVYIPLLPTMLPNAPFPASFSTVPLVFCIAGALSFGGCCLYCAMWELTQYFEPFLPLTRFLCLPLFLFATLPCPTHHWSLYRCCHHYCYCHPFHHLTRSNITPVRTTYPALYADH